MDIKKDTDFRLIKEDGLPQCEDCEGEGFYLQPNGPDDFDRVKCECKLSDEADNQIHDL